MKKYKWFILLLNLILLLIYFNYSLTEKETILKNGQLVLLKLAPIDPRSLMQGDYMSIRYEISQNLHNDKMPRRGYCVVRLDSNSVASKVRLQSGTKPLNKGEYLIGYRSPDNWDINIGAESFFFQEGQAEKYGNARYGALKIDKQGNSLLVGLYDDKLKQLN